MTDPDVTRCSMTVYEAVLLILQGAALGEGDDVLVAVMGEPASIVDVATRLARQLGPRLPP